MHPPIQHKLFLLLLAALLVNLVNAQRKDTGRFSSNRYYPAIRFMVKAPVMLPALYKAGKLNEIKNFADNWGQSPMPSDEFIFAIHVLIAAQNNNVSIHQMPWDYMRLLDSYAKELANANNASKTFKYYIKLPGSFYTYDATNDALKLLQFLQAWANNVMEAQKLTDSTSLFVCRVFAGSISTPSSYFKLNKYSYVEMDSYDNSIDSVRQQCFVVKRNNTTATFHILTGVWLPNGNLATLGAHPSVGIQFGGRNKWNEYDVTWSFRFLNPTPHMYTVLRDDTLYNNHYYDGGYAGFDYTRYVIHKTSFEAGFMAGMGYDYFDAFNGFNGSENNHHIQPSNIGSFDFNVGLNLKYFIHRGPSIGIQAKYHCVNYINTGGTDLGGNAVTIDFSFGAN